MPFTKINDAPYSYQGNSWNSYKGVVGLPDIPQLSKDEMQRKFQETVDELVIPIINRLMDELASSSGAADIGVAAGGNNTVQSHISTDVSTNDVHGIQAYVANYVNQEVAARITEITGGQTIMSKSIYDPTNKNRDVFAYVDTQIYNAITGALTGNY